MRPWSIEAGLLWLLCFVIAGALFGAGAVITTRMAVRYIIGPEKEERGKRAMKHIDHDPKCPHPHGFSGNGAGCDICERKNSKDWDAAALPVRSYVEQPKQRRRRTKMSEYTKHPKDCPACDGAVTGAECAAYAAARAANRYRTALETVARYVCANAEGGKPCEDIEMTAVCGPCFARRTLDAKDAAVIARAEREVSGWPAWKKAVKATDGAK